MRSGQLVVQLLRYATALSPPIAAAAGYGEHVGDVQGGGGLGPGGGVGPQSQIWPPAIAFGVQPLQHVSQLQSNPGLVSHAKQWLLCASSQPGTQGVPIALAAAASMKNIAANTSEEEVRA